MNRIIKAIGQRISPFLFKKINSRVKKNFIAGDKDFHYNKKKLLYSTPEIINNLQYKDENWNHIKYMSCSMWNDLFKWKFLKQTKSEYFINNDCLNTKAVFDKKTIRCQSKGKNNDWIFLKFEKLLFEPYLIEFDAKILSETTEFQFAFNYKNLGERYRFNLINNKQLSFEIVYGGFFHNQIISVPFSLEMNRFYNFKVVVLENIFSYLVDDNIILSVNQRKSIIENGELAFILWDSDTSNIGVVYENMTIYKI